MKKTIKVGQYGIVWIGETFKEHFGKIKVAPKKCELFHKILESAMNDKAILEKWSIGEITLDEFVYILKNKEGLLTSGYANIFYIRDDAGVLWAVRCFWYGGGWCVCAYSVGYPVDWDAGYQVFSRNSFDTLNSQTLCNFDPLKLEFSYNNKKYKIVEL